MGYAYIFLYKWAGPTLEQFKTLLITVTTNGLNRYDQWIGRIRVWLCLMTHFVRQGAITCNNVQQRVSARGKAC